MSSIQDIMRSVGMNRTSPSGGAVFSSIMPSTVEPTLSPTAKYIADMQALMSGGIGKLSTGEKISALGQVLQAAGSRGASDPAAVLQNVRQQQMQKLNAQYQIAQARKQAERAALMKAQKDQIISTLPAEMQAEARLVPDEIFFASYGKKFERFIAPETYAPTEDMKNAAARFPVGSPAYKAYLDALSGVGKTIVTPEGLVRVPGIPITRQSVMKNGRPMNVVVIDGKVYEE
jgi:hypothetical protein